MLAPSVTIGRGARTRAIAGAGAILLAACGPEPAPISPSPPPTSLADAGASLDASAEIVPPPAVLAALADRGPIASRPLALGSDRWLALGGTSDLADAAWIVRLEAGAARVTSVALPAASRVVVTLAQRGRAFAIVESRAALDMPAGLRALVTLFDERKPPWRPTLAERARLGEAKDATELAARLAALDARANEPPPEKDPMREALEKVHAPADLASVLDDEGADVVVDYEGAFAKHVEHLTPSSVARAPIAPQIVFLAGRGYCGNGSCAPLDADGDTVSFRYVVRAGRAVLRSVELPSKPAPLTAPGAPRAVPAGDASRVSALFSRLGVEAPVLAAAPLRADGTGAVSVVRTNRELMLVFSDGPYAEAAPLRIGVLDASTAKVGFADSDGDGRTDVIVFGDGTLEKKSMPYARVFLTPREVSAYRLLLPDPAALLTMRGARTLEAAVAAALTVPRGAVDKAIACRVVAALGSPATAAGALAPGARLFSYHEPSEPEISMRSVGLSQVRTTQPVGCAYLRCDARRPVCSVHDEPAVHYYYVKPGAKPALEAVVVYDGS